MLKDEPTGKDVSRILNRSIIESLGGPEGEPDSAHILSAALSYVALKTLGLVVDDEPAVRMCLSGSNSYGLDFISVAKSTTMLDGSWEGKRQQRKPVV